MILTTSNTPGFLAALPLRMAEAFAALALQVTFRGDVLLLRDSGTEDFGKGPKFRHFPGRKSQFSYVSLFFL